ncbi:uncharacterized protein G2W53_007675 [Senna tora]|uniref:Uncharacterized protein n=1 Tax=Senna tora TaxID=362788 RepID=A0A834X6Y8_9FABA|nr:uncharacterized protein G2W53_007675 [Senna tora]
MAWEERGSCINIFRTTNRCRILETFTNYEAKTCCASESNKSVCVVLPSRITMQKTCWASESNTLVRVVFANRVVLMRQLQSWWHARSVDHVLTYSGQQIAVGSQKPS